MDPWNGNISRKDFPIILNEGGGGGGGNAHRHFEKTCRQGTRISFYGSGSKFNFTRYQF